MRGRLCVKNMSTHVLHRGDGQTYREIQERGERRDERRRWNIKKTMTMKRKESNVSCGCMQRVE